MDKVTDTHKIERSKMDNHQKLLSVLIAEDKRENAKHNNIYRIGLFLEALAHAEGNPRGLVYGINNAFTGRLRDKLLKAIEVDPNSIIENQRMTREEY